LHAEYINIWLTTDRSARFNVWLENSSSSSSSSINADPPNDFRNENILIEHGGRTGFVDPARPPGDQVTKIQLSDSQYIAQAQSSTSASTDLRRYINIIITIIIYLFCLRGFVHERR
jgi:hypothetical protein